MVMRRRTNSSSFNKIITAYYIKVIEAMEKQNK